MTLGIQLGEKGRKQFLKLIKKKQNWAECICQETEFQKQNLWGHSGDKLADRGRLGQEISRPEQNTFRVWPRVTESLFPSQTQSDSHRRGSISANSSCTQSSNYYNLASATTVAAQKTHYYSRARENISHIQQTWHILPLHWLCETEGSPPLSCIVSLITSLEGGHLTNMEEIETTFSTFKWKCELKYRNIHAYVIQNPQETRKSTDYRTSS